MKMKTFTMGSTSGVTCVLIVQALTFVHVLHTAQAQGITKCEYNATDCSCNTDKGKVTLKPLSKDTPYELDNPSGNEKYYLDPCKDFSVGGIFAGAIRLQLPSTYFGIGTHSYVYSQVTSDGYAEFFMFSSDYSSITYMKCICTENTSIEFDKEDPINQFLFNIRSPYCCPGHQPSESFSLSAGSIILIIFFTMIVLYLVIGVLVQVGVRKAEGRERVPNVHLWTSLPGLIRDGFRFIISGGKSPTTYSKI